MRFNNSVLSPDLFSLAAVLVSKPLKYSGWEGCCVAIQAAGEKVGMDYQGIRAHIRFFEKTFRPEPGQNGHTYMSYWYGPLTPAVAKERAFGLLLAAEIVK